MADIDTILDEIEDNLFESFYALIELAKEENPQLYEKWKDGGFMVNDQAISHAYPNAQQVINILKGKDNEYT